MLHPKSLYFMHKSDKIRMSKTIIEIEKDRKDFSYA